MKIIITEEFESGTYRKDWLKIASPLIKSLNQSFEKKFYGEDIIALMIVFRVYFDYSEKKEVRQYNRKEKAIVLSTHVNADNFVEATPRELVYIFKREVLSSLNGYFELRYKPKDFSFPLFYVDISRVLE
jgi:hypothetical protein